MKSKKMFEITSMPNKGPIGVEVLNKDRFLRPGQRWFDIVDIRIRGFKQFNISEKIEFLHAKKYGRKPLDFENFGGFWMLSTPCKEFFEEWCSSVMEFVPGNLNFADGSDSRYVWLADVHHVIDALCEDLSDIKVVNNKRKQYHLAGSRNLVFYREKIGNCHLFRMQYAEYVAICDVELRESFRRAGLKGAAFTMVGYS